MIYTPEQFREEDLLKNIDFMSKHPFATLISSGEDGVKHISKIPLIVKKEGEKVFLEGHVAKKNTHWKYLEKKPNATIVFDGQHYYVSPKSYESLVRSLPTWNYATVIIKGKARIIESKEWLMSSTSELSTKFESDNQWMESVDKSYLEKMSNSIIGLRFEVLEIHAKNKFSQNKKVINKKKYIIEKYTKLNDEVLAMIYDFYKEIFLDSYDLEKLKTRSRDKNKYLVLFAMNNSEPIGLKVGFEEDGYFHSWIGGVKKDFRGNGVAKQLTKTQHVWAKEQGYQAIRTHTDHRYNDMIIHNIRNGFEVVSTEIRPDSGIRKLIMKKKL